MNTAHISGATLRDRGIWFWLLDANGDPITGEAANVSIELVRSAGISTGAGTVSEEYPTTHPGLLLYDPAVGERVAGRGVLFASHADQPTPAPAWPFYFTADDVTAAGSTPENIRTELDDNSTKLANLDAAISGIPASVRTNLATELGRLDAAISTRLAAAGYTAPDNAGIAQIASAVAGEIATAAAVAAVQTALDAVQAKTDQLAFTNAGKVDATVAQIGSAGVQGAGVKGDKWRPA